MADDLHEFLSAHPELMPLIRKEWIITQAPVTPRVQVINALALGVLLALIATAVVAW